MKRQCRSLGDANTFKNEIIITLGKLLTLDVAVESRDSRNNFLSFSRYEPLHVVGIKPVVISVRQKKFYATLHT